MDNAEINSTEATVLQLLTLLLQFVFVRASMGTNQIDEKAYWLIISSLYKIMKSPSKELLSIKGYTLEVTVRHVIRNTL